MKLYSIKPLEWELVGSIRRSNLNSGLCYYEIERIKNDRWKLKTYENPDDYYSFVYDTVDEAKAKAQEDWNNRISQYLTEYKEGE